MGFFIQNMNQLIDYGIQAQEIIDFQTGGKQALTDVKEEYESDDSDVKKARTRAAAYLERSN